eukprot:CAMPEP_0113879356 /NCGR_PEP_ID=MMETSP0780_2-20120614/7195_1 /TAXON_ID=652834 /ORGANISM="Palpitomonas bilix" /LENGTH=80 /DNA_ID=CAMNT_0000865933 /DNA_START=295 /DNA_END=538 /DNA_ORIENTATION=- /assembly_acc=CAM_ASM_000599
MSSLAIAPPSSSISQGDKGTYLSLNTIRLDGIKLEIRACFFRISDAQLQSVEPKAGVLQHAEPPEHASQAPPGPTQERRG